MCPNVRGVEVEAELVFWSVKRDVDGERTHFTEYFLAGDKGTVQFETMTSDGIAFESVGIDGVVGTMIGWHHAEPFEGGSAVSGCLATRKPGVVGCWYDVSYSYGSTVLEWWHAAGNTPEALRDIMAELYRQRFIIEEGE